MKKLLSVLLAACLLLCSLMFVGCRGKTAAEKLSEAMAATQAFDSYGASVDMLMDMSMLGVSMEIPMMMDIKIKDAKSENPVMQAVITMEMLGMELEVPMYMENEWVYMSVMGQNYRMKAEEAEDADYAESVANIVRDLPSELLEGKEMVQNEDGTETVTVEIPGDIFTELYAELLKSVNESSAEGDLSTVTVSDAVVSITIKDGLLSVYDIEFVIEMSVEGVTAEVVTKATCTYNSFGEDVVITPPEGYLDYPELSEDEDLG